MVPYLLETVLVIESCSEKDVTHKVQHVRRLAGCDLAPDHEVSLGLYLPPLMAGERGEGETARLTPYALCQLYKVFLLCTHLC